MAYRNRQLTLRVTSLLEAKLQGLTRDQKISRNKIIENILLEYFDLPRKLSVQMSDIIWEKLNDLELKIENINNTINSI